jgi:hypothetical protein
VGDEEEGISGARALLGSPDQGPRLTSDLKLRNSDTSASSRSAQALGTNSRAAYKSSGLKSLMHKIRKGKTKRRTSLSCDGRDELLHQQPEEELATPALAPLRPLRDYSRNNSSASWRTVRPIEEDATHSRRLSERMSLSQAAVSVPVEDQEQTKGMSAIKDVDHQQREHLSLQQAKEISKLAPSSIDRPARRRSGGHLNRHEPGFSENMPLTEPQIKIAKKKMARRLSVACDGRDKILMQDGSHQDQTALPSFPTKFIVSGITSDMIETNMSEEDLLSPKITKIVRRLSNGNLVISPKPISRKKSTFPGGDETLLGGASKERRLPKANAPSGEISSVASPPALIDELPLPLTVSPKQKAAASTRVGTATRRKSKTNLHQNETAAVVREADQPVLSPTRRSKAPRRRSQEDLLRGESSPVAVSSETHQQLLSPKPKAKSARRKSNGNNRSTGEGVSISSPKVLARRRSSSSLLEHSVDAEKAGEMKTIRRMSGSHLPVNASSEGVQESSSRRARTVRRKSNSRQISHGTAATANHQEGRSGGSPQVGEGSPGCITTKNAVPNNHIRKKDSLEAPKTPKAKAKRRKSQNGVPAQTSSESISMRDASMKDTSMRDTSMKDASMRDSSSRRKLKKRSTRDNRDVKQQRRKSRNPAGEPRTPNRAKAKTSKSVMQGTEFDAIEQKDPIMSPASVKLSPDSLKQKFATKPQATITSSKADQRASVPLASKVTNGPSTPNTSTHPKPRVCKAQSNSPLSANKKGDIIPRSHRSEDQPFQNFFVVSPAPKGPVKSPRTSQNRSSVPLQARQAGAISPAPLISPGKSPKKAFVGLKPAPGDRESKISSTSPLSQQLSASSASFSPSKGRPRSLNVDLGCEISYSTPKDFVEHTSELKSAQGPSPTSVLLKPAVPTSDQLRASTGSSLETDETRSFSQDRLKEEDAFRKSPGTLAVKPTVKNEDIEGVECHSHSSKALYSEHLETTTTSEGNIPDIAGGSGVSLDKRSPERDDNNDNKCRPGFETAQETTIQSMPMLLPCSFDRTESTDVEEDPSVVLNSSGLARACDSAVMAHAKERSLSQHIWKERQNSPRKTLSDACDSVVISKLKQAAIEDRKVFRRASFSLLEMSTHGQEAECPSIGAPSAGVNSGHVPTRRRSLSCLSTSQALSFPLKEPQSDLPPQVPATRQSSETWFGCIVTPFGDQVSPDHDDGGELDGSIVDQEVPGPKRRHSVSHTILDHNDSEGIKQQRQEAITGASVKVSRRRSMGCSPSDHFTSAGYSGAAERDDRTLDGASGHSRPTSFQRVLSCDSLELAKTRASSLSLRRPAVECLGYGGTHESKLVSETPPKLSDGLAKVSDAAVRSFSRALSCEDSVLLVKERNEQKRRSSCTGTRCAPEWGVPVRRVRTRSESLNSSMDFGLLYKSTPAFHSDRASTWEQADMLNAGDNGIDEHGEGRQGQAKAFSIDRWSSSC